MARASINVRSQHEADAVKLALEHPAIRAASVITGLLLQLQPDLRRSVLRLVDTSLLIANAEPDETGNGDEPAMRLLDGSDQGGTGE